MQQQNQANNYYFEEANECNSYDPFQRTKEMESELLQDVNRFFIMLGIDLNWDDYVKYIDFPFEKQKKKYCNSIDEGFTFSSDTKAFFFYASKTKKPNDYSPNKYPNFFYDDRKFAIAALCYEHICQRRNSIDKQRMDQRQIGFPFYIDTLAKANYYLQALGSDRRFKSQAEISKWRRWNVYWSTPKRPAFCYSTCSGNCVDYCKGSTCMYVFPSSEKDYENLPDAERTDPRNVFDDDLFWLSEQFAEAFQ